MAGEVLVDALPYIDQGYDDPGVREAVSTNNVSYCLQEHKGKINDFALDKLMQTGTLSLYDTVR